MHYAGEQPVDLGEVRAWLRSMSDVDLLRTGRAAARLVNPRNNFGKKPRPEWTIQLREARAEWRRRFRNDSDHGARNR